MRKALRRLLTCRGFHVEEYEHGKALFAALDLHPPDYLLLDLHMPGINGFDVLETLHSREATVPVIVITAHDEPGTAERVLGLGAAAYLKKPVDREALFAAIAAAATHVQKQRMENTHATSQRTTEWLAGSVDQS